MGKWRVFTLGKYRLSIYAKWQRHTGTGYRLGCGHDIVEICHSLTRNGVEIWHKTVGFDVKFEEQP